MELLVHWKHPLPKDAVLTHTSVPHEPIDDYELPVHIEVDYSKAKPNRFVTDAHRTTAKRIAVAKGVNRRTEPTERHTVTLYGRQVAMLRTIDTDLSRAIRKVLDVKPRRAATKRVRK